MTRYVIKRLIQSIPIFFGITIISYALMLGAPGGPVAAMYFGNTAMSADEIKRQENILGVNDPFYVQYLRWLLGDDWMRRDIDGDGVADTAIFIPLDVDGDGEAEPPGQRKGILRGDFGLSFFHRRPAVQVLTERLGATLELGAAALLVGLIVGISVGVLAAVNHGRWFDQVSRIGAVVLNALPNFWLGLILLLIFGSTLRILPLGNRCKTTLDDSCPPLTQRLEFLILPTIVLAGGTVAGYSRFMRTSMLDVVSQDYIRTAYAKGLNRRTVWVRHGLRNALLPIATFLGPSITFLLGGAAVTETVFSWPGVGRLAVNAVGQRDFPVVMAVTIYTALATILGYLLSDILYAALDPRIRFEG